MARKKRNTKSEHTEQDPNKEITDKGVLFTAEEEQALFDRLVKPSAEALLQKELEVALGDERDSSAVRGRMLDRMFGKPTERKTQGQAPQISIQILSLNGKEGEDHPKLEISSSVPLSLSEPEYVEADFTESSERLDSLDSDRI